jgi:hypothetical protein
LSAYQPVTVDAAGEISDRFEKNVVVIVTWDRFHDKLHVTTYGRSASEKAFAANLGETLCKAAGADLAKAESFEDFRTRSQAQWALERDQLLRITPAQLTAAAAAIANARGGRRGLPPISNILEALPANLVAEVTADAEAAIAAARSLQVQVRGGGS